MFCIWSKQYKKPSALPSLLIRGRVFLGPRYNSGQVDHCYMVILPLTGQPLTCKVLGTGMEPKGPKVSEPHQ